MIFERGSKKWVSLMLPEHRKMLSVWQTEQDYDKKPELDEQKWEEISRILTENIGKNTEVIVTYYKNHYIHKVTGRIVKHDYIGLQIQLLLGTGNVSWLKIMDITDLEIK